jgi:antitoxin PrlF
VHKAKLTSKGQITIPAAVRETLGLQPGDKIVFLPAEDGVFRVRRARSILDLEGCVPYSGPPVTIEEMNEAIAEHVAALDEATKTPRRPAQTGEAA